MAGLEYSPLSNEEWCGGEGLVHVNCGGGGGELCARAAGVDGRALRAEREARRSGNVAKQ